MRLMFNLGAHHPMKKGNVKDGQRIAFEYKDELKIGLAHQNANGTKIISNDASYDLEDDALIVIYNDIMPDNNDSAKVYVNWRMENKGPPMLLWISMKSNNGIYAIMLMESYCSPYSHEMAILKAEQKLMSMRGAISIHIDQQDEPGLNEGDLIMARLNKAVLDDRGYGYKISEIARLANGQTLKEALSSFTGTRDMDTINERHMFATLEDVAEEENDACVRTEENEALVAIYEGHLTILERRGIRTHKIDDLELYLEAEMPEEDGIWYLKNLSTHIARDWESGHAELEVEADWRRSEKDQVERFFPTRESLEAELEGQEVSIDHQEMTRIYGDESAATEGEQ